MSRANRWLSDSQANAEALARRDATYTAASGRSFETSWDWHNREPRDLREACRMVIQAYADEVPSRLHEHATGEDGTPRMHPAAEAFIFGWAEAGWEKRAECDCGMPKDWHTSRNHSPYGGFAVDPLHGGVCLKCWTHKPGCASIPAAADFYRTPFKAALSRWLRHSPQRAAIVAKVALGSKGPQQAAVEMGVPPWCAKDVAWATLRAFLRDLSDVKITLQSEGNAA